MLQAPPAAVALSLKGKSAPLRRNSEQASMADPQISQAEAGAQAASQIAATRRATRHAARLSVAPMMDWTDRNCRLFHREISRQTLLYTEMVTAPAVINGKREMLLDYHEAEHPVALQLGGSDPKELSQAVRIAGDWGYDEINLNCGCPSDRVQSGAFGAVLMKTPELVADCVAEMIAQARVEVTVKCRIGGGRSRAAGDFATVLGGGARGRREPRHDPRPQSVAARALAARQPRDSAAGLRSRASDEARVSRYAPVAEWRCWHARSGEDAVGPRA